MAKVGTLTVDVTADTSGLTRGVDAGKQKLGEMNGAMNASIGKMKLMAAAAVAAGAALLVNMVKNSLETVDALSKTARALDGTIDGLRALQIAAGYAGISNEQLTTILRQMSARLGEAETGTGTTAEALKRLGLDAQELGRLDLDARLAVFADRIHELGLSGQQTAYILRELGVRAGPEFIDFMRSGGDAIRAANREVIDLGLSVSKLEGEQVEAANDAMTRLGNISSGVAQRLALELAPAMEKIAGVVGPELIKFSQELNAELNRVAEAAKFVTTWLDRIRLLSDIHLGTDLFKPPPAQDGGQGGGGGGQEGGGGDQNGGGGGLDGGFLGLGGDNAAEKWKAQLEAKLEAERDALERREEMLLEEDEREILRYEERLLRLQEYLDAGVISEQDAQDLKEQMLADHLNSLDRLKQKEDADDRRRMRRLYEEKVRLDQKEIKAERTKQDMMIGIVGNALQILFGQNKAAATAFATIQTLAGIARALADYPWPYSLAVGAAVAVAGAAQIAAINRTNIGSTAAPPSPSPSAIGQSQSAVIPAGSGASSTPTQVNINLTPGSYTHEQVRDLIEALNEAVADGARLRVS